MPEVIYREQETLDIAATQGGQIVPAKKPKQISVQRDDNSLAVLILFVPILFLLAVTALLLERGIKWGFRRFFASTPTAIAPSNR